MDIEHPSKIKSTLQPNTVLLDAFPIDLEFVEKVFELSEFAFDFYKREKSIETKASCTMDVEKLMITNLHTSFSKVKSDWCATLKMIKEYLSTADAQSLVVQPDTCYFINRLSHGVNCQSLEQEILGLKLIAKILQKQEPALAT